MGKLVLMFLAMLVLSAISFSGQGQANQLAESTSEKVNSDKWEKTFGGLNWDGGASVWQTKDDGYIIVGDTYSYGAGSGDIWLIKTGADGNEKWNKTFGGPNYDVGNYVQQTSDSGYIIVGETSSYGAGNHDIWLIKTDAYGNETWNKTFGGSEDEWSKSVQQTSDGGYIIVAETRSYGSGDYDVWLIKTDSNGNKEWDKTFGGYTDDKGGSVQQTNDGGYIITGETECYFEGGYDLYLIKVDSNGNKQWDKTFGGSDNDIGNYVQQTSDSGYIIVGETSSYGAGSEDIWLIKTDAYGNETWNKTFGGSKEGSKEDRGKSVQQTSDGGYIIVGETHSYATNCDTWLIKTDAHGNKMWDKTFGGFEDDQIYSVQRTSDSGYIMAGTVFYLGTSQSDVWLIKTDGLPGPPGGALGGTEIADHPAASPGWSGASWLALPGLFQGLQPSLKVGDLLDLPQFSPCT